MTMTLTEKRESRQAVAVRDDAATAIENLIVKGDLKALSPEQRNQYYLRLCDVTGLNPMTQPFEYLTLNGKLVLYAKKACTDQLRALHGVSVVDMDQEEREGLYSVTVKVQDAKGRTDMDIGSVNIGGLKGDARANAIMKASTKAKRRATLSICGLGLLDETEIETIPGATPSPHAAPDAAGENPPRQPHKVLNPETGRMIDPNSAHQQRKNGSYPAFEKKAREFTDIDELEAWWANADTQAKIEQWPENWQRDAAAEYEACQERLLSAGRP